MANARDTIWGADRSRAREGGQRSLSDVTTWGGPRKGAGRRAGARPRVAHRARPKHARWCPVHVTMRRGKGLPSLRAELVFREIVAALRQMRREDFRIVEYSVQADHVHLLVEAENAASLAAGVKTFAVRVARRINLRVLRRRRGRVWGDRYHRRDLPSPREVRNALVYIINNHMKHGESEAGLVDACSSGPWFKGWAHGMLDPPADACPAATARTWLVDEGWHRKHGYIHLGERPRAARSAIPR
jgi:putative transposase